MNRRARPRDPEAGTEAQKYERPIPSRTYILERLSEAGVPCDYDEVRAFLGLEAPEDREALRRRLRAMCRDGQLLLDRLGRYALVTRADLQQGTVDRLTEDRVEVVLVGSGHRVPLRGREQVALMDGDRVLVEVRSAGDAGEDARLVEVIEHAHLELVGRYRVEGHFGYVQPLNRRQLAQDVVIAREDAGATRDGEFVRVRITRVPDRRQPPTGEVIEVLGELGERLDVIDVLLEAHEIPVAWPEDVEAQLHRLPRSVTPRWTKGRVDLRDRPLVTIDGVDAKDFDDAVHAEKRRGGGWRLTVAIADVSTYVKESSALDRCAADRGNSVYLPGRVVPMLPEALSNDLCSLRPEVDRLALVCEMTVSARGRLTGFSFYEAVIRSHARLTYEQVWAVLEAGCAPEDAPELEPLVPRLQALHDLYRAAFAARGQRGALEISDREIRVLLDDAGEPVDVAPVRRTDAHRLIEECMILANVAAARFLADLELGTLYRIHERPDPERVQALIVYLEAQGIYWKPGDDPQPGDFRALTERLVERADRGAIETMILRTMTQAVYAPGNVGHFGLALSHYTHFTSPIRRYADLLVHRAIRSVIHSRIDTDRVTRVLPEDERPRVAYGPDQEDLQRIGDHISMTERRADAASRQATEYYKCVFLEPRVGEVFSVTVTGVKGFGLFVEIPEVGASGLIHVTALPRDYYHFDDETHLLAGEHNGLTFGMGDRLEATLTRVDPLEGQLDFVVDENVEPVPLAPRRPPQLGGRRARSGGRRGGPRRDGDKGRTRRGSARRR